MKMISQRKGKKAKVFKKDSVESLFISVKKQNKFTGTLIMMLTSR
jgi:hypothetical protein